MKKNKVIYWIATGLVILLVGIGSAADLLLIDPIRESMKSLGIPLYLVPFFGVMKILGTLAILIPSVSRFREAAYAGMMFYFIGAVYCHIMVGDGMDKIGTPLLIFIAITTSYVFSKRLNVAE